MQPIRSAFLYLFPFLVGADAHIRPRDDVGMVPYNINFTNYDATICNMGRFTFCPFCDTIKKKAVIL